jgi:hypothetical protein
VAVLVEKAKVAVTMILENSHEGHIVNYDERFALETLRDIEVDPSGWTVWRRG